MIDERPYLFTEEGRAVMEIIALEEREIAVIRVPGKTRLSKSDKGNHNQRRARRVYEYLYRQARSFEGYEGRVYTHPSAALRSYRRRNAGWLNFVPFWKRYGLGVITSKETGWPIYSAYFADLSDIPF